MSNCNSHHAAVRRRVRARRAAHLRLADDPVVACMMGRKARARRTETGTPIGTGKTRRPNGRDGRAQERSYANTRRRYCAFRPASLSAKAVWNYRNCLVHGLVLLKIVDGAGARAPRHSTRAQYEVALSRAKLGSPSRILCLSKAEVRQADRRASA